MWRWSGPPLPGLGTCPSIRAGMQKMENIIPITGRRLSRRKFSHEHRGGRMIRFMIHANTRGNTWTFHVRGATTRAVSGKRTSTTTACGLTTAPKINPVFETSANFSAGARAANPGAQAATVTAGPRQPEVRARPALAENPTIAGECRDARNGPMRRARRSARASRLLSYRMAVTGPTAASYSSSVRISALTGAGGLAGVSFPTHLHRQGLHLSMLFRRCPPAPPVSRRDPVFSYDARGNDCTFALCGLFMI